MLSWVYFSRYIFSKRSGSLVKVIARLSVLGIAMGVFSFVLVLSIMNGFNDNIRERILSVEPHLIIRSSDSNDLKKLEESSFYKKVKSLQGVQFSIFENQDIILRTIDGAYRGAMARGLKGRSLEKMFSRLQQLRQKNQGEEALWEEEDNFPLEAGEVVIGVDLAQRLGVLEGDTLTVIPPEALLLPSGEVPRLEKVVVRKIITTNVSDVDSKFIFYQLGKALHVFKESPSRYLGVELWLDDMNLLEETEALLQMPGAIVESWKDRNAALFFALKLEKLVIGLFLCLSGLMAVCSVITVMLLLVSQKKQEIGVLMALGMSSAMVTKIFGRMGFLLSLLGIIGGMISSFLAIWLLKTYPLNVLPGIYYDSQIPVRVDLFLVSIVFLVSVVLAFMSAWLPARSLSGLRPSLAIRDGRS